MSEHVLIDTDVLTGRKRLQIRATSAVLGGNELPPPRESWLPERPTPAAHAEPSLATWEALKGTNLVASDGSAAEFKGFTALLEGRDGQLYQRQLDVSLSADLRQRHVLAVGKTGSGKTSKTILPMIWTDLLDQSRTVIIFDAKGDLTPAVLEMARRARPKSSVLYFAPLEPERSLAWNPFDGISDIGHAEEIALCLSAEDRDTKGDGSYFRMQAEKLICDVLFYYKSRELAISPHDLKRLFDLPATSIARELKNIEIPTLTAAIEGNKNGETTLLQVQNYMSAFTDPRIASTTSCSEFNFAQLVDQPSVLIIRANEGVRRLEPLMTILVSRLFSYVIERADLEGGSLPRPVSCFIDEFASALGRLPDVEYRINTFRSRGFFFTAAVQSLGQLRERYGSAASVLLDGFGTLIGIPPLGLTDAQFLSEKSGTSRFLDIQTASPSDPRIVAEHEVLRPVLLPAEIANPRRHPEKGMMLTFLLPESQPLIGYATPVWKLPGFEKWDRAKGGSMPQRQVPKRKRKRQPEVVALFSGSDANPKSGITDTRGMPERAIRFMLETTLVKIGWKLTSGNAKTFWESFMRENDKRIGLVLRLAEELAVRKATINEFYLAFTFSNTDNIQAVLHYLDYTRVRKQHESKRRLQKPMDEEPDD